MVDPTGFREIVAANPLLITGAYILLAMGGLLFLLGFLGCCGAVRENKCLLLFVSSSIPHPTRGCPGAERGGPCVYTAEDSEVTPRSEPRRLSSRSGKATNLFCSHWWPQLSEPGPCDGPMPAVWAGCPQMERGLGLQV